MVTLKEIEAASSRISEAVRRTPLEYFEQLSDAIGNRVWVKLENHQRTGSFKERGALNKLLSLTDAEKAAGVVCASAGNHAQGVAFHSQRLGIASTIVMPENTPLVKVSACRAFGAEVILHGANYDEALGKANEVCAERTLCYVHPFDDPHIIAGQGTTALEILEDLPDVEAVVVPVGGGGLISGIAAVLKAKSPSVKVYGVEPARIAAMEAALSEGGPVQVPGAATLADGLNCRKVGDLTFEMVKAHVDGIATVEEAEIASAILQLMEREKTVVEGAGAVGLAALMNRRLPIQGKKVVLVISGGNIDVNILSRIIERGLVKDGRLVRLRVTLPDVPGALAQLTQTVAHARANVVEIHHQRAFGHGELGETDVEVTLETRGFDHIDALKNDLMNAGYRVSSVTT